MPVNFHLQAKYSPKGDQPQAITQLVQGVRDQVPAQVLLGVTGSGKTFTVANAIAKLNCPALVISHNKTLAAQLYGEFKQFFPNNLVEYFISYYDYYQPEAYVPSKDLYIAKELSINDEIEKLRLRATASLLSGRRDVIVVASVSCIYGLGNPAQFEKSTFTLCTGDKLSRDGLMRRLVDRLYTRNDAAFQRGNFRAKGDTVDVFPSYADEAYRIVFWGDEVESLQRIAPDSGELIITEKTVTIFPSNLFLTEKSRQPQILRDIQRDLVTRIEDLEREQRFAEAVRLKERVESDVEMIRTLGYCAGIENYSRYLDGRKPGERAFCLLDYFPKDYLLVIDESHVTVPQLRAMWGGDRSRKLNLVHYGFRLPSALDNRPLTFQEFESMVQHAIYVSATPADYELDRAGGVIVEQVIRPTGLLDPMVLVRPTVHQMDDILQEIRACMAQKNRILITTLTKRLAEKVSQYLLDLHIPCAYIHSEIDTFERVEIIKQLRLGTFEVLVGVNLLREGLDIPEVSLVVILDADKEGFLRNEQSLIQTIGRASRNVCGKVIMYADHTTASMQRALSETTRRRNLQMQYNKQHHIVPTSVRKDTEDIVKQTAIAAYRRRKEQKETSDPMKKVVDAILYKIPKKELLALAQTTYHNMKKAADEEDFAEAIRLRDEWNAIQTVLKRR